MWTRTSNSRLGGCIASGLWVRSGISTRTTTGCSIGQPPRPTHKCPICDDDWLVSLQVIFLYHPKVFSYSAGTTLFSLVNFEGTSHEMEVTPLLF